MAPKRNKRNKKQRKRFSISSANDILLWSINQTRYAAIDCCNNNKEK